MADTPGHPPCVPVRGQTGFVQLAHVQFFDTTLAHLLDDVEEGTGRVEVSADAGRSEVLRRYSLECLGLVFKIRDWVERENLIANLFRVV